MHKQQENSQVLMLRIVPIPNDIHMNKENNPETLNKV